MSCASCSDERADVVRRPIAKWAKGASDKAMMQYLLDNLEIQLDAAESYLESLL